MIDNGKIVLGSMFLLLAMCTPAQKKPARQVALENGEPSDLLQSFCYDSLGGDPIDFIELEFPERLVHWPELPELDDDTQNQTFKFRLNDAYQIVHHQTKYMRSGLKTYRPAQDQEVLEILGKKFLLQDLLMDKVLTKKPRSQVPYVLFTGAGKAIIGNRSYLVLQAEDRIHFRDFSPTYWFVFDVTKPQHVVGHSMMDASSGDWGCFRRNLSKGELGYIELPFDLDTARCHFFGPEGPRRDGKHYLKLVFSNSVSKIRNEEGVNWGADLIDVKNSYWYFDLDRQ